MYEVCPESLSGGTRTLYHNVLLLCHFLPYKQEPEGRNVMKKQNIKRQTSKECDITEEGNPIHTNTLQLLAANQDVFSSPPTVQQVDTYDTTRYIAAETDGTQCSGDFPKMSDHPKRE